MDNVKHPSHYINPKGLECRTVIETMQCSIACACKYLWRYEKKKNPIEDLKKAIDYIDNQINLIIKGPSVYSKNDIFSYMDKRIAKAFEMLMDSERSDIFEKEKVFLLYSAKDLIKEKLKELEEEYERGTLSL